MNNKPIRIFLVGGAVRDSVMGRPCNDNDYSIEAPNYDAMCQFVEARGGEIFDRKPQFLTVRAKMPNIRGSHDFVLCRKEGAYRDGRHPDKVEVGSLHDDLARRDFTMNAMAVDLDNETEIIDPFNGLQDIKNRMIRCVGEAHKRFDEDKLRPFRALRFHVTLGFTMAASVCEAIRELTLPSQFDAISTERIQQELAKMFEKDSFYSFHLLTREFPVLGTLVTSRGIWFKPTVPQKEKLDLTRIPASW